MGLYYRPTILSSDPEKLDPYLASTNLVLPMDMYLYNYKDSENMDLITAWNPDEEQWWICSFNPNVKYEDNRVENQVMIGSVQFPNDKMYEAFILRLSNNQKKYIVLDENNRTVWICWCEESLI